MGPARRATAAWSGDEVGKADHARSGVRPENGSDLGQLDVDARILRRNPLSQLLGVRLRGAVHDGELAHVAVPFEELDQPGECLRPSARSSQRYDLAVFQLQDR